jgi:hypothetical protein
MATVDPTPFLVDDSEQLIGKQYADRPQLRPVLDAVLAALPALGPVSVQARGTYVSLVSPRRTFAVVQATTKSRVDLGLRLASLPPGGRVCAAKNLGQTTARIPLTSPEEVDEEVLGWLRLAYEQNTAPAPPRQARRPAPALGPVDVLIEGSDLPGLRCQPDAGPVQYDVYVALFTVAKNRPALDMPGGPWRATEPVPADSPTVSWQLTVQVRRDQDGYDFGGPYVRGDRSDRHLGLAWGILPGDGTLRQFRGAKLRLAEVPPGVIADAMRPGYRLVARVKMTDTKGYPVCARLRPSHLTWSAEPGPPAS